jgi:DnaA family protein
MRAGGVPCAFGSAPKTKRILPNDYGPLRSATRVKQLALDFASPPLPTLDNFIPGRNGELLQNLRRLAGRQGGERFVYVWGRPAGGRTHLLRAVVAELQRAGAAAVYISCAAGAPVADGLERMECVALDDVDRLDGEGQVAAFDLYNALREHNGALLAAGAAPPVQLELREDLVTRLAWGLVYQVHALNDEEKSRALSDYAAGRGFQLQPEVRDYLLTRGNRSLSSLLVTVDALDRYSLETKRPVTVPLARELLYTPGRPEAGMRAED